MCTLTTVIQALHTSSFNTHRLPYLSTRMCVVQWKHQFAETKLPRLCSTIQSRFGCVSASVILSDIVNSVRKDMDMVRDAVASSALVAEAACLDRHWITSSQRVSSGA